MRRYLVLSVLLMGSLGSMWELGRLMPSDAEGSPGDLVTPVPTGEVQPWHLWSSTDSAGVTTYCMSNHAAVPYPPVTESGP